MILKDKVAVIHGAGGDVGGAVARAFAREGATLFLSGRNLRKVEAVAADVNGRGGVAEAAQVDALDDQAVEKYVGAVVEKAGYQVGKLGIPLEVHFSQSWDGNGGDVGVPILIVDETGAVRGSEMWEAFAVGRLSARKRSDAEFYKDPATMWESLRGKFISPSLISIDGGGE